MQKTGLETRERANVLLRMSFQTPVQVLQNAAVNGMTDRISGISGPLIMGAAPKTGTKYNGVQLNRKFIQENTKSAAEELDDL